MLTIVLRNFYNSAIQKTGKIAYADQAEKITFNAIMGFRNEEGTVITYGKSDNCSLLDGHEHHAHGEKKADPRFKYSPTHSDPAICCVPNYTRNFPYYLDYTWLKAKDGLVATLYAPSVLNTEIQGQKITIEQKTNYPFDDQIQFTIDIEKEAEFALYFRKPNWTKSMNFEDIDAEITEENGYYKIIKVWQKGDQIQLKFNQELKALKHRKEDVYFQRGALVYAYPIPHEEKTTKTYDVPNFRDYHCLPTDDAHQNLRLVAENKVENKTQNEAENFGFTWKQGVLSPNELPWYQQKIFLEGEAFNTQTKQKQPIKLFPMGSTILRRVTFETE